MKMNDARKTVALAMLAGVSLLTLSACVSDGDPRQLATTAHSAKPDAFIQVRGVT